MYGFCAGFFGRDARGDKRVEAVGWDWVVVREDDLLNTVYCAVLDDDTAERIQQASDEEGKARFRHPDGKWIPEKK